jgi:hypothetical protein
LFYLGPGRKAVMAADVRPTLSGIETTAPHQLFEFPWTLPELVSPYDVTADGQRFLALQPAEGVPAQLTVILNWQAGLKK